MKKHRVKPDSVVNLNDIDPADTSAYTGGKKEAKKDLRKLNEELETLQEMLYAQNKHKVLIVLQGIDTSGKDSTIRHVFEGVRSR